MNYGVSLLLNYFLIFIEAIAFIVFFTAFFQQKVPKGRLALLSVLLTSLSFLCLALTESNTALKLLLLSCADSLLLYMIYRTSPIKCIGVSILFLSFVNAIDNFLFVTITTTAHIDMRELSQDPYGYYLVGYISKICAVMAFSLVGFYIKQKSYFSHTTWRHWLKILPLPLASTFISVFLWRLYWYIPSAAKEILSCTIALLVMNLFAIAVLNYLDHQQQLFQDNLVLQKNIQYQNEAVDAWADAYKDQRKLTHDFRNQLSVIYGLVEREASRDKLLSYIQTLLENSASNPLIVKTGRLIADILLSQKYSVTQAKGIQFVLRLDDLAGFGLDDEYLVVVLSNLIDNAIEACEKIEEGKDKKITLVMKVEEDSSFLYIENTTAHPVKVLDDQTVLPEGRSAEHGYGLRNVINILNRHDAVFAIRYKKDVGRFCFSTQIPAVLRSP